MTFLYAFILGIVEGVTEFLPISSTGHLILVSKLLGLVQNDFLKSFEIGIQLGAILAVVVMYWKVIVDKKVIALKVIAGFIPTAVIGLLFYKIIKNTLLGNETVVLLALFIGGIVLILFELYYKNKEEDKEDLAMISYKESLIIGLFQTIAFIPGVSRSAATIIGGRIVGLNRKTIIEFSFLLAIPTMMAATGLDVFQNTSAFTGDQWVLLLVGFATAFGVALFSIKFMVNYIQRHSFLAFGVYRIIIALLFWFM